MKKVLAMIICFTMLFSLNSIAFAQDDELPVNPDSSGEGMNVNVVPPESPIATFGSKPPSSSNQTVDLGTYTGSISYLCRGSLYDKWVKTDSTTITIRSQFRSYSSQSSCEKRENPLNSSIEQNMTITLVASDGSTIAKTVSANSSDITDFTVRKNMDYYIKFYTGTGNWVGGNFSVTKSE